MTLDYWWPEMSEEPGERKLRLVLAGCDSMATSVPTAEIGEAREMILPGCELPGNMGPTAGNA